MPESISNLRIRKRLQITREVPLKTRFYITNFQDLKIVHGKEDDALSFPGDVRQISASEGIPFPSRDYSGDFIYIYYFVAFCIKTKLCAAAFRQRFAPVSSLLSIE
jgi:hypothetical protein